MNNVDYLEVTTSSKYYVQSVNIRNDIMRKPLGLTISKAQLRNELSSSYHHYVAIVNLKVVSALTVRVNKKNIQVCQLATKHNYRRKGIARNLLNFFETSLVRASQLNTIMLFSRETSIDFYITCGYEVVENNSCEIVGLPHQKMIKFFTKI